MSELALLARIMGHIAYGFTQIQPFLPLYTHIIISALFPIIAASYASLSRPNSASKPDKSTSDDEDEIETTNTHRMEGLGPQDALLFPVYAGVSLTSLYFLIKWLEDPAILNRIINYSLSITALYGTFTLYSDTLHVIHSFIFPEFYSGTTGVWRVFEDQKVAKHLSEAQVAEAKIRKSPLPGFFGIIPLPESVTSFLWAIRSIPGKKHTATIYFVIHKAVAAKGKLDLYHIAAGFGAVTSVFCSFYLSVTPWWLSNLLGFSFTYVSLQTITPSTFTIGSALLVGLFFYDIIMVFYTPMMVTVATKLEIPAKLIFPRPATPDSHRAYAMLGLGDIVLPGLVMTMAHRFDLWLHYHYLGQSTAIPSESISNTAKSEVTPIRKPTFVSSGNHWSSRLWTRSTAYGSLASTSSKALWTDGRFPTPYFTASVCGYTFALAVTLLVNQLTDHPQPALLYLVPGVLSSIYGTALVRGELKLLIGFSDEVEEETEDSKKGTENGQNESELNQKVNAKSSDTKSKEKTSAKSLFLSLFSEDAESKLKRAQEEESMEKLEREITSQFGKPNTTQLFHLSITLPKQSADHQSWVEGAPQAEDENDDKNVVDSAAVELGNTSKHVAKRLRTS